MPRLRALALLVPLALPAAAASLGACHGKVGGSDVTPPPTLPAGVGVPTFNAAQRLTAMQYRAAIRDLFGPTLVLPPALEPDVVTPEDNGFESTAAARSSVSKRGVEQYETAAYSLANQIVADAKVLAATLPCTPSGPADAACAKAFAQKLGRRAFRRPLTGAEVDRIATVITTAAAKLGTFEKGLVYGIAAILQSPHFLYRPVVGEPDPAGGRRTTPFELATRLSFFLWNTIPDEALLAAAEGGALSTEAGLSAEVDRMLASPKARDGVRAFVTEWLRLGELDQLQKDTKVFTTFSSELGAMAREETLRTFEDLVFDRDVDVRQIYTSRRTFLNPKLAAMYQVPAPSGGGFVAVDLPEGARRGLLGHLSVLALYAHPTSSSATLRGRFVREKLLCQPIPNPPAGLNTAIPEPDAVSRTLRQRVKVHLTVPFCAGCHNQMDPIGLGLEQFDGIGRFRTKENGGLIDPSGRLDGVPFAGPSDLGQAIADHPNVPACFAKKVYQYATGQPPQDPQLYTIGALVATYEKQGYRFKALLAAVAKSPELRKVGDPRPLEAKDGGVSDVGADTSTDTGTSEAATDAADASDGEAGT